MSIENVTPSGRVPVTQRELRYWEGDKSDGYYSFPIDENGKFKNNGFHTEEDFANLVDRWSEKIAVFIDEGYSTEVAEWTSWEWQQSEWKCHCGALVYGGGPGDDFDCDKCGRMFNAFGQELAPIEQWGSETGETYSDIIQGRNGGQW